jgi:hypothetical protein
LWEQSIGGKPPKSIRRTRAGAKAPSRGIAMRYGICTKLRDRKSAKPSACRYFGKTPFSREVRIIGLSEDLNAELTESRPFLELKPFDRPSE